MKKYIVLLVLIVLLFKSQPLFAGNSRSDNLKPKWITHELPDNRSNTYVFVRAYGRGSSIVLAKQAAFVEMTQKLETERNLTINTTLKVGEVMIQESAYHRNRQKSESRQEIVMEAIEKGRKLQIVCREIDDYWVKRNGIYEVYVLYTVTDKNSYGGSYDDTIQVTARYPGAGFMSVVPSVAQFYKGSTVKGSLILGGEILAIGGIILCENTRASYIKKMHEQPKYATQYNSLADSWETGRNICIGTAVAIYAYNLIDAFVAKGAKRVVVKKNRTTFSAMPYTDSQSVGMALALKF